ncbi:hypothetical protein BD310DRAFT_909827, partial [Dichomitus squalens]
MSINGYRNSAGLSDRMKKDRNLMIFQQQSVHGTGRLCDVEIHPDRQASSLNFAGLPNLECESFYMPDRTRGSRDTFSIAAILPPMLLLTRRLMRQHAGLQLLDHLGMAASRVSVNAKSLKLWLSDFIHEAGQGKGGPSRVHFVYIYEGHSPFQFEFFPYLTMPQCEGCGTPFLLLEKAQCGICILRLDAMKMVGQPLADDEEYWQEYPQCKRCGGAFAGLDARIWGRCAKLAKAVSDVDRQQIM